MKNKLLVSFTSCARHTRPEALYIMSKLTRLVTTARNSSQLPFFGRFWSTAARKKPGWIDGEKIFRPLILKWVLLVKFYCLKR